MAKASASVPRSSGIPPAANQRNQNVVRYVALAVCGVLLICFFFIAWNASLNKSPTADEPLHLVGAWTEDHYDDFRVNPEDPPLWKIWAVIGTDRHDIKISRKFWMWNTMLNSEDRFQFARLTLFSAPNTDVTGVFSAARARMTFVGVMLGVVIAWWAWRLAGPIAAIVATAVMCLDPNFLAHAPLVKNDVSMTLAFMLFMMAVWFVGEKVSILRWIALALAMGVALTVKFSGILTFPMLAFALLARVLIPAPWPFLKLSAGSRLHRLGVALALGLSCSFAAYVMIWACYGFRFSPGANPAELFDQHTSMQQIAMFEAVKAHGAPADYTDAELSAWIAAQEPGLVDHAYQWADDNHILPQAWLRGFYYTWGRGLIRACFLLDQNSQTGWWYYFPLAMAFKTPLMTLFALLLAVVVWLRWRGTSNKWALCAVLVCPLFYAAAAMGENLNLGIRHILPVYPFLFIFLGVVAARAWQYKARLTAVVLALLFAGLSSETLCAYPDFIPFFNVAAGGTRGGLHLLGDSNLDWGQDLPALAAWQKQNPGKHLYLRYFGPANPINYHLDYAGITADGFVTHNIPHDPPLPAILAISATHLQGIYLKPAQRKLFEQFQHQKPIAVLGGTIYLFDHVEDWLRKLPRPAASTRPVPPR